MSSSGQPNSPNVHTYSDGEHTWDVRDLWEAAKGIEPRLEPITSIPSLEGLLDSHTWSAGRMTVREIMDHADRVAAADLCYPIILTPDGWVGDGCHRVVRAMREGRTHILVVRLSSMPRPLKYETEMDQPGRRYEPAHPR